MKTVLTILQLSQAMLGDNPEKSRNPLKKAIRRRNAKTVQFAPPTYHEPSEYEYSDEEEDEDSQPLNGEGAEQNNDSRPQQESQGAVAAPLALGANAQSTNSVSNAVRRVTSDDSLRSEESSPTKGYTPEIAAAATAAGVGANALADRNGDPASLSRKGVVRNTDSFFRDDSVETKKISLTPRLLRGDSEANVTSTENETRHKPSVENFDKILGPEDRAKEDKKKKDKKGMLGGLFKRKDRTPKGIRSGAEDNEKISEDSTGVSVGSKESFDSFTKTEQAPERKPSKLHKQPPVTATKPPFVDDRQFQRDDFSAASMSPTSIPHPSDRAPSPPLSQPVPPEQRQIQSDRDLAQPQSINPQVRSSMGDKKSIFGPIATVLRSSTSNLSVEQQESTGKPIHSKRAKQRFAIDESDTEDESTPTTGQHHDVFPTQRIAESEPRPRSPLPIQTTDAPQRKPNNNATAPRSNVNQSSADEQTMSRVPTAAAMHAADSDESTSTTKASPSLDATTPSTSRSTPTWSDASLRSYMDNDQGIKDLLVIIHDNSNVNPVGPDHPLIGNLFVNERMRLAEMQLNLDSMLTNWVAKKNATLLSN